MAQKGTRLLLWITAIGLLIFAAMIVAVVLLSESGPPTLAKDPGWLRLRVGPGLADAPGDEAMLVDPLDMPPLTTELSAALHAAAKDDEITGLFLDVGGIGLGWAQTQELRSALSAFQAAGKPCVAWADSLSNKEYYLASACGEVHVAPAGLTLVNGLAVTRMYYKGAFDKFGVSANFEHVGDFKSAVEPYERTAPSPAAQEATDALLDSLYSQLVAGIAAGRDVDEQKAREWVDNPPMTPQAALEAGMVDALSYRDEVEPEDDMTSMSDYLRDLRRSWRNGSEKVAVIYAEGAIISGNSSQDLFGSRYIGDRTLRRQLTDVREDEDVIAVVLRVNSPGGSGSASDAIWREVELTRDVKPVVVSMSDYAASGGYYISMGADRIFAEPGTLTGSIGVFGGKMNISGVYESLGVTTHTTQRGQLANLLSSSSDFNEVERERFRSFLGGFYKTFVQKAADGRDVTYDELHAVAQGRVWTGEQALERGLIDELGGLDAAIASAKELSQAGPDVGLLRIPERRGFLDQLMEELSDPDQGDASVGTGPLESLGASQAAVAALPADVRRTLGLLHRLETTLGTDGVVAMIPADIVVH